MAVSYLTSVKATPGQNGGTTGTMNSSGATLLVMVVSTGATATPTDSASNSWTELGTTDIGSIRLRIYYVINPATSATHDFTYSQTNSYPTIMVMAFQGTGAYDTGSIVQASVSGGTSLASGSITPSANNAVVITGFSGHTSTTVTTPTGFTSQPSNTDFVGASNYAGGSAYKIQTTAGAENPSWAWAAASDAIVYALAFLEASTSAGFDLPFAFPFGLAGGTTYVPAGGRIGARYIRIPQLGRTVICG